MTTSTIETSLDTLTSNKQRWARLPIVDKIAYLDGIKSNTVRLARPWVEAGVRAKGLRMDEPLAGEEWTGGPFAILWLIRDLRTSLVRLSSGVPLLEGFERRTLPDGTVCVDVFPSTFDESILFAGISAEMWMQPSVTLDNLTDSVGSFYRQTDPPGGVAAILGAGNISSIGPMDVLHALFNEGYVAVLKLNPILEYLGPILEEVFDDLVTDGFVRFEYGGSEIGAALTSHRDVDLIHITGSNNTYNAVVFGPGDEGDRRRAADDPIIETPVTAELGGVTPVIVAPGAWSKADIRFQAEHVVSKKMHNAGFNCVAAQVLVLPEAWDQAGEFLDAIRNVMAGIPDRPQYYPGSAERTSRAADGAEYAERFGAGGRRTLVNRVDAESASQWFTHEIFGPTLAVTRLPGSDVPTYLANATKFANEELTGTLAAHIIVDPKTHRHNAQAIETSISNLRYGTVCINVWAGAAYFMSRCAWGAAPGHTRTDIGSGIGFVHNSLMFDAPQKSVVRGPFAPSPRTFFKRDPHIGPKMIYMVTNKQAHVMGEKLIGYMDKPSKAKLAGIALSAVRA
jgi:aldehyde dehydrogenase (NAD(P)+)